MGAFLSYAAAPAAAAACVSRYTPFSTWRLDATCASSTHGNYIKTDALLFCEQTASNDSMEGVEDPVRAQLDRRGQSARRRYSNAKGCRSSTHMGRRMVLMLLRRFLSANSHDDARGSKAGRTRKFEGRNNARRVHTMPVVCSCTLAHVVYSAPKQAPPISKILDSVPYCTHPLLVWAPS